MAKLQANAQGELTGSFAIPPNVPAGAKKVSFQGAGGSHGDAAFTGRGSITVEQRRRIVTISEYHVDPLAQTFTLTAGRHLAAIDLWFTAKGGAKPVYVQIRGVSVGIPTSEVLAQGVIAAADIRLGGAHTRCVFDPIWVEANKEHAIVVLTDDPGHALAVAELGKYDPATGWVTQQPYQVGVLLSSSNASTWTPHQDRDLAFRLHAAKFTSLTRTVNLGVISAADATDIIASATVERPAADTNVEFVFTQDNGRQIRVGDGQTVTLTEPLTGALGVSAVLKGSALRSPVLYPGAQTVLGKLKETATYISRAFPCGANSKVTVLLDSLTPGVSAVTVEVRKDDGTYVTVPLSAAAPSGDGWEERTHILTGFTASTTRIRVTLSGTALYRPKVSKLRAVVT